VDAVGRRAGEYGRAVLLHEVVLDLAFRLALGDELADVLALLEGLGRLGDIERLVADDAHEVVDDRRVGGLGRGRGRCRGCGRGAGERQREGQREDGNPGALHDFSARMRGSVSLNHCAVTGKRCSAWIWPLRLITNVSGTPVVPNELTNSP